MKQDHLHGEVADLLGVRKPKGRKDPERQEAVLRHEVIEKRIEELTKLHHRIKDAQEAFSEAIKRAATDSGFNASVVRRFVAARASEEYEKRRRDSAQLELLFEEMGE